MQLHAARLGLGPHRGQHLADGGGDGHRLQPQPQAAAVHLRQRQHVVHHAQQLPAGLLDVGQVGLLLRQPPGIAQARCQQLRKTEHGIERGAQLVAHARQERGLGLAGGLRAVAFQAQALGLAAVGQVGQVGQRADGTQRGAVNVTLGHAATRPHGSTQR